MYSTETRSAMPFFGYNENAPHHVGFRASPEDVERLPLFLLRRLLLRSLALRGGLLGALGDLLLFLNHRRGW